MNRKVPYDQKMVLIILSLVGFGLAMVFSASAPASEEIYGNSGAIFARQLVAVLIGLGALLVAMKIDYRLYCRPAVLAPALAVVGALMLLPHFLHSEEAARWIRFGPAQFQPSELAKVTAIVFAAWYLARKETELESFRRGVLPLLAVVGGLIALVLLGKDLGTAACIAAVCGLMLFAAGLPYRHVPLLGVAAAGTFALLVASEPYRVKRLLSFLDPAADPTGAGYQIRQSLIALGSGGMTGVGFADGRQKLHYLPEPHTDFIFAVVGEELGLVGCLVLLLLFGLFLWRGVRIALKADSPMGAYLGLGLVAMVVLQALINMSVVVQLLPTKGLPLPFVSVGGSSMMVFLGAMGMLLNISKHTRGADERRRRPRSKDPYPSPGDLATQDSIAMQRSGS